MHAGVKEHKKGRSPTGQQPHKAQRRAGRCMPSGGYAAGGSGGGGLIQRLTVKSHPVSDLGAIKCAEHTHKSQDPQLKVQTTRLQEATAALWMSGEIIRPGKTTACATSRPVFCF